MYNTGARLPRLPHWSAGERRADVPFCLWRIIYKPTLQYVQKGKQNNNNKKQKQKTRGERKEKAPSGSAGTETLFSTKMNPVQRLWGEGRRGQTEGATVPCALSWGEGDGARSLPARLRAQMEGRRTGRGRGSFLPAGAPWLGEDGLHLPVVLLRD